MEEFKYNKSGKLYAYKNGKKIGSVTTMGDMVSERIKQLEKEKKNGIPGRK